MSSNNTAAIPLANAAVTAAKNAASAANAAPSSSNAQAAMNAATNASKLASNAYTIANATPTPENTQAAVSAAISASAANAHAANAAAAVAAAAPPSVNAATAASNAAKAANSHASNAATLTNQVPTTANKEIAAAAVASANAANTHAANAAANAGMNGKVVRNLQQEIQPPHTCDAVEGGKWSIGNYYADNNGSMMRLRYDSASGRYSTTTQDVGAFMTGLKCASGETPNIDGACPVNNATSPPSVLASEAQCSQQLDSMFLPFVEGGVPELSQVAKTLIHVRSPYVQNGTVYGRLAN